MIATSVISTRRKRCSTTIIERGRRPIVHRSRLGWVSGMCLRLDRARRITGGWQ